MFSLLGFDGAVEEVEHFDKLLPDLAFLDLVVDVVDGDVAQLTADADDGALVCHIVVETQSRDGSSAGEFHEEGERLDKSDLRSRLLHLVDQDLLVNERKRNSRHRSIGREAVISSHRVDLLGRFELSSDLLLTFFAQEGSCHSLLVFTGLSISLAALVKGFLDAACLARDRHD